MPSLRDAYEALGLPPNASLDEVRTGYRRLSKRYHPDVNQETDAAERFREIKEAYETTKR